jgi:hypothetical protein
MSIQLFDTLKIEKPRRTSDGYLVADVRAGRVGIQTYRGVEVGKPEQHLVRVYRPEEEVFKDAAMASFTSIPVTLDHPSELVSSKNWRKFAVGFTGEGIARDGGFLRVPLTLKDEDAIAAVDSGKRELSFGYTCDLDFTAGVTEDGQEYDAVQRSLHGNHLAIVNAGRAGPECRIGDNSTHGGQAMAGENLKTITVDGIPVVATDAAATVIDTLQKRIEKADKDRQDLVTVHNAQLATKDAEIAAKDKELGTKDGEINDLKGKVLDAKAIDALVAERAAVLAKAQVVATDGDYAGKTVQEVRRAAVAKKLGDAAVAGKSDDYVEALFDREAAGSAQTASVGSDPIRDSLLGASPAPAGEAAARKAAFDAMMAAKQNAWQNPLNGKAN